MKLRVATLADLEALDGLIERSAHGLSVGHYTPAQVDAALQGAFGVDTQLIRDRSYFVLQDAADLVACGGWSFRRTLFGGDTHNERSPERLDPAKDAAKVRAFFVAPEYARQGLGARLLEACEKAAREAGFHTAELMSTLPGQAFYAAHGYVAGEPSEHSLPGDVAITFVPMRKRLLDDTNS